MNALNTQVQNLWCYMDLTALYDEPTLVLASAVTSKPKTRRLGSGLAHVTFVMLAHVIFDLSKIRLLFVP